MPLRPYRRPGTAAWWAKGRIEYNGRRIGGYRRASTGATDEAGAWEWCRAEETRAIAEHLTGRPAALTFAEAVLLYPAKPAEAGYLLRILEELGPLTLPEVTPDLVKRLAPKLYPKASADTWRRQVVVPVSAVINNAHQNGHCAPIRVRGWTAAERAAQDRARGKPSRVPKRPGDLEWLAAFMAKADPYNAALAAFMYETAARIGQAVALRPADLDLSGARVWLAASKGHPAQWVAISADLAAMLARLPPRAPHDRKRRVRLAPRVFGYATRTGPLKTWRAICHAAGIDYRAPHAAGRHGFYTELRVRQGVDPVTAARAGRWSGPALPDRVYAHSETEEAAIRERVRAPVAREERPA